MPVIPRLIAGFKVFRAQYYEQRPDLIQKLVREGQKPEAMIIACSDSRVDPAIVLQAEPGELFVVRNVASAVPPYQPDGHYHGTSAALEFAVRDLEVRHIVVLGHSGCGGIRALCDFGRGSYQNREFIAPWVSILSDALHTHPETPPPGPGENTGAIERAAVEISLANLRSFPWVGQAVAAGTLQLHGWWFDIDKGELWGTDGSGPFQRLA